MPVNPRSQRVADRIQVELSDIIHRRMKDPRTGFVTITGVEVSPDLRAAKVYFSALDEETLTTNLETFERAKGFLRSQLGQRLHLRHTPELMFYPDHSAEHGLRVESLLKELRDRGELGGEEPE